MSNNIDQIRYTLINGTPVGDLCDLIMYIGQQSHAPTYVKNVTYLNDILTFTKQDDTQVVTSPLVTTNTEQTISETKKFSKGVQLSQGLYSIYTKDDSKYLNVCGGAGINAGCLYLYGNSTNDADAGSFKLSATVQGTIADTSKLQGYHDGTLTWTIGSNAYSILLSGTDQTIGGVKTFTSDLTMSNADIVLKTGDNAIKTSKNDSFFTIVGGTDYTTAPLIQFNGSTRSTKSGYIEFKARDTTGATALLSTIVMNPDGTTLLDDYITVKPKNNGTSTEGTTRDAIYATNTTAGSSSWLSNVFFTAAEAPDGVETRRYSVLITRHSSSNGVIYAYPFSVDDKIYQCRRSGGTWGAWKSISFS